MMGLAMGETSSFSVNGSYKYSKMSFFLQELIIISILPMQSILAEQIISILRLPIFDRKKSMLLVINIWLEEKYNSNIRVMRNSVSHN